MKRSGCGKCQEHNSPLQSPTLIFNFHFGGHSCQGCGAAHAHHYSSGGVPGFGGESGIRMLSRDWTNPGGVTCTLGDQATVSLSTRQFTDPIRARNFNFTKLAGIPNDTEMDGVEVTIRSIAQYSGRIQTHNLKLKKADGSCSPCDHGTNCSNNSAHYWGTNLGFHHPNPAGGSDGSTNARWGFASLTRLDVVQAHFGVYIIVENCLTGSGSTLASIDEVRAKVYWTIGGVQDSDEACAQNYTANDIECPEVDCT